MFMLNTSKLQQHELRMLSGMARHVSLQTECANYSEELSAFLKDKDTLLVDVVKALKRITNEWRSWNHKLFGGLSPKAYVASVDQIYELLEWTEKTYPTIQLKENGPKSHWKFCVDTLKRYITVHAQMQRFYSKFIQSIYSPLTAYYTSRNTRKTVSALRQTLNNWSLLQQTGTMISESCFTAESIQFFMEIMYYPGCRDFYLVLRLIPDLCMKAAECIQMAKILLDANESDGFSRERAYIFEVWRPIQNMDIKAPLERKLSELSKEKDDVESKATELSLQRKTLIESMQEIGGKIDCVTSRIKEKTDRQQKLLDHIAKLTQDLAYYKFQARELKRDIGNSAEKVEKYQRQKATITDTKRERMIGILSRDSSEESALSYSYIRNISSSTSLDALRMELRAAELEAGKIQEQLTSSRNDLFKIENDLKLEVDAEKRLTKAYELLEKDKSDLDAKLCGVEMEDRVLAGYVSRIKKNIINTYKKLPPLPTPKEHSYE